MKCKINLLKIINYIVDFILILFIVINSLLFIQIKIHPESIPSFLGYKALTVLSGSMEPAIGTGDLIIVKDTNFENITEGDIISYELANNMLVTHRVNEVTSDGVQAVLLTKGDSNNVIDEEEVEASQLVGCYLFKIPKLGYITEFTRTPIGLICVIIIPIALLIAIELKKTIDIERKNRKKLRRRRKRRKQRYLSNI